MNFLQLNLGLINELQKLRQDAKAGKISADTYYLQVGGIAQVGKAMDRHINFLKFEKQFKASLTKINRVKGLVDPEEEKIPCPGLSDNGPGRNKTITRTDCLDWSGETPPKFEECDTCEYFTTTRTLLLPEK